MSLILLLCSCCPYNSDVCCLVIGRIVFWSSLIRYSQCSSKYSIKILLFHSTFPCIFTLCQWAGSIFLVCPVLKSMHRYTSLVCFHCESCWCITSTSVPLLGLSRFKCHLIPAHNGVHITPTGLLNLICVSYDDTNLCHHGVR